MIDLLVTTLNEIKISFESSGYDVDVTSNPMFKPDIEKEITFELWRGHPFDEIVDANFARLVAAHCVKRFNYMKQNIHPKHGTLYFVGNEIEDDVTKTVHREVTMFLRKIEARTVKKENGYALTPENYSLILGVDVPMYLRCSPRLIDALKYIENDSGTNTSRLMVTIEPELMIEQPYTWFLTVKKVDGEFVTYECSP